VAPAPTLVAEDVVLAGAVVLGDLLDGRAGAGFASSSLRRGEGRAASTAPPKQCGS
jgi:hypothetical protein